MNEKQAEHVVAKTIATLIGIAVVLFVAWRIYSSNPDIRYLESQQTQQR
jgi:hypothetical protein